MHGYKRASLLFEASVNFDEMKVLIRLAHDMHAIQDKSYVALSSRLVETGKLLGGWIKSAETKTNKP